MAGGDLFRKEAFDKVSSPEELDQIMVVTSWRSWILLSTTVFLLGSAIAYGFLGRIPDLVPGQGMILEGGHIIPVQSDIRGTVSKIHVKVGDQVKYEDELMVLEALKMENPIYAPADGTVAEIKVSENDNVEANQVLIVLD